MLSGTRDSFSSTVYKSACLKVGGQYLFICSCVYRIAWSTSRQTWNRFVQEAAFVSRLSSVASFCCIRHSTEWSLTPALATALYVQFVEAHSKLFKKYKNSNAELIGPPNAYAFCMIQQRINNVASTNIQEVVGRKVTQGFNRMVSLLYPCQQHPKLSSCPQFLWQSTENLLDALPKKYQSEYRNHPLFLASSFGRLSAVVPLRINKILLTNK